MKSSKKRAILGSRIEKQLLAYAVAAGATIVLPQHADAKIVYSGLRNLQVDRALTLLNIDLNGDGVDDVQFLYFWVPSCVPLPYTGTTCFTIMRGITANVLGNPQARIVAQGGEAKRLALGNPLGSHQGGGLYYNASLQTYGTVGAPFNSQGGGYIGVYFTIGGNRHAGWISYEGKEVSPGRIAGSIKDWAYDDEPVTPGLVLPAGDDLVPLFGVPLDTQQTSETMTIRGLGTGKAVSITGGEYSKNNGAFIQNPGTVSDGDTVQVRLMSSSVYGETRDATLTIDGKAFVFSVTTIYQVAGTVLSGSGSISCVPSEAGPGGHSECTITPIAGWYRATLQDNSGPVINDPVSPYVIDPVNENHTVAVTFGECLAMRETNYQKDLAEAISALEPGDTLIKVREATFPAVTYTKDNELTLSGGYNSGFGGRETDSFTTITGNLTITTGSISMEYIEIQ